jgi:hypothetical protein
MQRFTFSALTSLTAAVAMAAAVSAQTPEGAAQSPAASSSQDRVTVVGCIQREADFRRAQDAGKGGVAGTGVGAGNEFVLTDATPAKGASAGAAGATGTVGASTTYELTGPGEGEVAAHVGKRVEITGTLKAAETTASGRPTGGATAGQPPSGVDVTSKDLKLRELEVSSVKEASGTCPSK